jgi:hypothetical protein
MCPSRQQLFREGLMNSYQWVVRVSAGMLGLGLSYWAVLAQLPLDVWVALPEASDGSSVREISGAAATDRPDRVVLISDEDASHLYDLDLANTTVTRLPFTTDAAGQIDDLEGLTRRPSDGVYFMIASLSRQSRCREPSGTRLRLGSFRLVAADAGSFRVEAYVFRGRATDSLRTALIAVLPESVRRAARVNNSKEGGLDVEALAFVPAAATPPDINRDALLLGLRGPLTGTPDPGAELCQDGRTPGQGSAFYVYLVNPDAYLQGAAPDLRGPYTLDLDDRGFRDATVITIPGQGPRLLIIAGRMGEGNHPGAYLFNTRDPSSRPIPIALPANSSSRVIEGAVAHTLGGVERLILYEDKGDREPSEAVITALPPPVVPDSPR